jgi:hypothetical protein
VRLVEGIPSYHTRVQQITRVSQSIRQTNDVRYAPPLRITPTAYSLSKRRIEVITQPPSGLYPVDRAYRRKHFGGVKHREAVSRGESVQVGIPDHYE